MDVNQRINQIWSNRRKIEKLRLHWWNSKTVVRHINKRICQQDLEYISAGTMKRATEFAGGRIFHKGISVGCGTGQKEMHLINSGLVEHFDLFELSEGRITQGTEMARTLGLENKVTFHHGDAFELVRIGESYDFVHWNNSLHHMMDVEKAVQWSHEILCKGGLFYMDDFIGPSRFQWTDEMLDITNRVRQALPRKYLLRPSNTHWSASGIREIARKVLSIAFPNRYRRLVKPITRPTVESMIEMDPSEAADSGRIIEMVKKFFPSAQIEYTGGVVYHLTLNEIIYNFHESKDRHLLELLLIIDDLCSQLGENHYAIALALKE